MWPFNSKKSDFDGLVKPDKPWPKPAYGKAYWQARINGQIECEATRRARHTETVAALFNLPGPVQFLGARCDWELTKEELADRRANEARSIEHFASLARAKAEAYRDEHEKRLRSMMYGKRIEKALGIEG